MFDYTIAVETEVEAVVDPMQVVSEEEDSERMMDIDVLADNMDIEHRDNMP